MSRDRAHLLYIQRSITRIRHLTAQGKTDFFGDEDKQAAVLYYLQTLSESASRLPQAMRDSQPQIAWHQMRGFRNRVVHDYMSIDLELVWLITVHELQSLAAAVDSLLGSLPSEDSDDQTP